MIKVQGPGKGLSPAKLNQLIGHAIDRNVRNGDYFVDDDIEDSRKIYFRNSFRSRWGLISRFSDAKEIASHKPKVVEFHLAEKDFHLDYTPNGYNIPHLIIHSPEYIGDHLMDLCSANEAIRNESIQIVQQTVDLTKSLISHYEDMPKVVIHPGAMSLNVKLNKNILRQALLTSLESLNGRGIELLLENMPPYPWYFGGQWKGNYFMDADEIQRFCTETGYKICFDLSHAALYCNAKGKDLYRYIQTVKPFIRHIHFADAYGLDGEGVQIGEGDIDFEKIMPLFADYTGTWVPEIWRGHLQKGKGFIEALSKLRNYDL